LSILGSLVCRAIVLASIVSIAAASGGLAWGQTTAIRHVLVMSDLHFDPMADPRLVDRLAVAEPDQWRNVLDDAGDTTLGKYGQDTRWALLRSALEQMKLVLPSPTFVLISGDFLAHNLRREFDAAAGDHSDAAYRVFLRKTMQFIAQQLRVTFPDTPIVPTLGNNDAECGDYQHRPGGPFLADTLPILHAYLGTTIGAGFNEDWASLGNYSVEAGRIRILSLNTNFFSIRYRNACGAPDDPDPGRATLGWLEGKLAEAEHAQEHVWLVYHIPPGIDGYATFRRGTCPGGIIPMWKQTYAEPFFALLHHYSGTIVASFAGHTHMDDFRVIGTAGGRYAFALITPAISPIFGQNPAFRTVDYDPQGGILDHTTYDLTNLSDAKLTGDVPPAWQAEYSFTKEWHLPRADLPNLDRLFSLIQNDPGEGDHWHTVFPVSSAVFWPQISQDANDAARAVRAFRCASGNVLPSDYERCYCGAPN
jgi:hypothetical protein